MEFNFSVGETTSLSEVSNLLANLSNVFKWIFFIMLAIIVIRIFSYIKRKNAPREKTKHS